jgi:hypothetical protein
LRFIEEVVHPSDVVMVTTRMRVYPHTRLAAVVKAEGGPAPTLDLRDPGQFYLSPDVGAEWLDTELSAIARRRNNVMYMDSGQRAMVAFIQRIQAVVGQRGPTWAAHPAVRGRKPSS